MALTSFEFRKQIDKAIFSVVQRRCFSRTLVTTGVRHRQVFIQYSRASRFSSLSEPGGNFPSFFLVLLWMAMTQDGQKERPQSPRTFALLLIKRATALLTPQLTTIIKHNNRHRIHLIKSSFILRHHRSLFPLSLSLFSPPPPASLHPLLYVVCLLTVTISNNNNNGQQRRRRRSRSKEQKRKAASKK